MLLLAVTLLLSHTANGHRRYNTPEASQPTGGRKYSSQPGRCPTAPYEGNNPTKDTSPSYQGECGQMCMPVRLEASGDPVGTSVADGLERHAVGNSAPQDGGEVPGGIRDRDVIGGRLWGSSRDEPNSERRR